MYALVLVTSCTLKQDLVAGPTDVCAADAALLARAFDGVEQFHAADLVGSLDPCFFPCFFCICGA